MKTKIATLLIVVLTTLVLSGCLANQDVNEKLVYVTPSENVSTLTDDEFDTYYGEDEYIMIIYLDSNKFESIEEYYYYIDDFNLDDYNYLERNKYLKEYQNLYSAIFVGRHGLETYNYSLATAYLGVNVTLDLSHDDLKELAYQLAQDDECLSIEIISGDATY